MSFITEFYYGNIVPSDKGFKPNSQYAKVLDAVLECEQRLENELDEGMQKHLSELIDANGEFLDLSTLESFADGFRLGASFMLDTFVVNDCGTADIQKK